MNFTMESGFLQFNLGNFLTILSFLFGGVYFANTMRNDVNMQSQKMDLLHIQNTARLSAVESEIRTLREVLVETAELKAILNSHESRITEMYRRLYEDNKTQARQIANS